MIRKYELTHTHAQNTDTYIHVHAHCAIHTEDSLDNCYALFTPFNATEAYNQSGKQTNSSFQSRTLFNFLHTTNMHFSHTKSISMVRQNKSLRVIWELTFSQKIIHTHKLKKRTGRTVFTFCLL